jgi:tRNA-dihydrouridine synthase
MIGRGALTKPWVFQEYVSTSHAVRSLFARPDALTL